LAGPLTVSEVTAIRRVDSHLALETTLGWRERVRYRFGREAELLAAWESARHVVVGPRAEGKEEEAPAAAGEVKPAA
jgi:hypothetical protein